MSANFSTLEASPRHGGEHSGKQTQGQPRRSERAQRRRAIWRRAGLVLAGTILGFALGELMARALRFEFRPHMRNRVYFAEPDPLLGWRNRAGASGPYGGDEFLTRVTMNARGQRGRELPTARTPGTTRIALLGDSQAWGDGVGDTETFAALLDGGDGGRVEVINFASPGYGTDQQLLVLDNQAARYAPDVVLVAVYLGNDLRDNLSPGTFQYPKPYFTLAGDGSLALHGVPVPIPRVLHVGIELYRAAMRHSVALNAIGVATAEPRPTFTPTAELASEPPPNRLATGADADASRIEGLELTERLLVEIARHARAIGARPVFLILPDLWQVDVANHPGWRRRLRERGEDWRMPQRELERALTAEGALVIDALPALARASRDARTQDEHTYYRAWRHLTARGHRTIARLLAPRLGVPGPGPAAAAAQPRG
jgi:hypothetical protein